MTILVKSFFFEHFFWIVFALVNSYYLNCGYYTYVTKQNKNLTMNLFVLTSYLILMIFLIWHDLSILLQPIQILDIEFQFFEVLLGIDTIWQSFGLKIRFSSLSFIPPITISWWILHFHHYEIQNDPPFLSRHLPTYSVNRKSQA